MFITTENGVESFAADYRKISWDYPSDTVVIQNTNPGTSPSIVLKDSQGVEIRFDCKNDDCLANNFDRWKTNLVPLDISDKTIVDGNSPCCKYPNWKSLLRLAAGWSLRFNVWFPIWKSEKWILFAGGGRNGWWVHFLLYKWVTGNQITFYFPFLSIKINFWCSTFSLFQVLIFSDWMM